jgi:hypothetical protein
MFMVDNEVSGNIDLSHEKVVRWLALLFLAVPCLFALRGLSAPHGSSLIPFVIFAAPFFVQLMLMIVYRGLSRNARSGVMVLSYIGLIFGMLFSVFALYIFFKEGRRATP